VTVGGIRLHYLDWAGGEDDVLLLVPGMENSAHVYRALAPALAGRMRVVAVSPRGHGPSEAPAHGYGVAASAVELAGFLDALGIARAAVAGHSLAGQVVTRLAADHPERVSRLVYLDGVYDYGGWGQVQRRRPVHPPAPEPGVAQEAWLARHVYGFWDEALHADWQARPGAEESARRREHFAELLEDVIRQPAPYARVRCPALALVAAETVETVFPWLEPGDAERGARAEAYLREVREPWRRAAVERFRREAADGRVVEVDGHHFLHLTSVARVAAEMLAFLLPAGGGR
jgi:pimeloyl-ACP methyl ester carboxylesterase